MPVVHHEQHYLNSCVPACICMIQAWRGLAPTEEAFHRDSSPKGHDLDLARELGHVRVQRVDPGEEGEIDLALRLGRLVIASVLGAPYIRAFARRYPGARSRHGTLCAPGTWGGPLHALLLIGRDAEGYAYHDPWYPAAGQPFQMAEDDFQRCFAGRIAVAEP